MIVHLKRDKVSIPPGVAQSGQPRRVTFFIPKFLSTLLLLVLFLIFAKTQAWSQQNIVLATTPGGVVFAGAVSPFSSGFGNVNGLGVGIPPAGLTVITAGVAGGVLYTTPYSMVISGASPGRGAAVSLSLSVGGNFVHPADLTLMSCYPSAACTTAASYTAISTNPFAPTVVIPATGVGNAPSPVHSACS